MQGLLVTPFGQCSGHLSHRLSIRHSNLCAAFLLMLFLNLMCHDEIKLKRHLIISEVVKLLLQLKFLIHVHSNINFLILNFLQNRLVWYAVQSILVKHKILIQAHYSFIFPYCIQINNDHALSWSFQPPSKDLQFYELFESDQLVLF